MNDVLNLQRKIKIDTAAVRNFVADLPGAVSETSGRTFTIAFIGDDRMIQLNQLFRDKDTTTDVLSFPHEPEEFEAPSASVSLSAGDAQPTTDHGALTTAFLGDIVISAEQAQKQAAENDLTLDGEIKQLILHGLLHLCGYDHETDSGEMNTRELELRAGLGI